VLINLEKAGTGFDIEDVASLPSTAPDVIARYLASVHSHGFQFDSPFNYRDVFLQVCCVQRFSFALSTY